MKNASSLFSFLGDSASESSRAATTLLGQLDQLVRPGALIVLACLCMPASAQTDEWTWMGGSNKNAQFGVYGTLGTPGAGNVPGSRAAASSWTDGSGHLWLFGGSGADQNTYAGDFNDLWEFNPSTNEWAWMGGSSTIGPNGGHSGVYGALGAPAAGNIPGGRGSAASWIDRAGHVWLFGGSGNDAAGNSGQLNDLWEFNPSTREWVWMGGSSTMNCPNDDCSGWGVYGTRGVPAPGNIPGGRSGASSLADGSGNLWLFGGYGWDPNADSGNYNDLWKFNPSTKEWAWMTGSSSIGLDGGQPGSYGALGTPAAGNTPGGRMGAMSWTDSSGHLWLFGGWGYDAVGNGGYLDDLWKFSPSTNEWTWMGGIGTLSCADNCSPPGVYGALGTPAPGNIPGGRENAASWTDSGGHFWLFGGYGYDADGNYGKLNDFWELDPSTKEWAWMGGSRTIACNYYHCGYPGVYGELGTPAAGNIPGSRNSPMSWTDSKGQLWLFGGNGFDANGNSGDLNDLWKYQLLHLSLSVPSLSFGPVKVGAASASQSVTMTNFLNDALSISSIGETGADASSFIFANNCGTSLAVSASCIVHGHFAPKSAGALTATITISDNATNSPQTIKLSGTGLGLPPTLSATSLSFGSVKVGTVGESQSVTLTNTSSSALPIGSITLTGADASSFDFTNSCGTSLAAKTSCIIHGHFAPMAAGALKAAITITDDASNSPQVITLSGTGVGVPVVSLSATSLSFGTVKMGATSPSQSVTMANTGTGALSIASIGVTGKDAGSFAFANNCGTSLAAKASCVIHGHFAPAAAGPLTAAITIADNAAGSPQSIKLAGTGE